ncbi:MAG: hypothetical protein J5494_08735 [Candidatus Methanomethylophilaceae archaeon]|nr:hypothetical protein [Candidatus Methanomethylophilaceae archaeon]
MRTDYNWLFCKSDLAGVMVLALDLEVIRSRDLLRVDSRYDHMKKCASVLEENGLLISRHTESPRPATTYSLTHKGRKVAVMLKSIKSLVEGEYSIPAIDSGNLDEELSGRRGENM